MLKKLYDFKNFKGDFTGGLVAGVVALPLALAFGVQSGMGATAGLYGAIAVGIFAALFGGTETQASGPTGPMTVVSAALVAIALNGGDVITDNAMSIIVATFLLGGILQIIFGFLNIASYVKYFPYPVISGFMSGVGLIIVILQIFPFAGMGSSKSTVAVIQNFPSLFTDANVYALLLGGITIAVYYLFPKVTKAIPSALVALIVATLIAYFMKMDVPLIGEIPSGLPSFQLGGILEIDSSAYATIVEYAVVLAVLGSIDSLLTSVIADNMTKTKHNSNRELIGQGIGNMIAAAIGGIPGAGATKGTVVNINAGGKTRVSGVIHGLFLLAVLLGLGQLAAHIPLCVLAGLLIPIGFKIVDFKGLKHLLKVPRADAVVMILVLLITTFGSLIQAVGIGIALACLLFMKKSGDISEKGLEVGNVADIDGAKPWQDELEFYEHYKEKVIIKHLYGSLFFGFTSYFKDQINLLPKDITAVIFRMDRVPYMDQSGLYALEDIIFDLRAKNIEVIIVGLQEQPCDMLKAVDIIPDLVPEEDLFTTIDDSFEYLRGKLKQ
ncbi:STAS domain-containing protein [Kordia sp. TARA_039_SRF]|nr:STAS domain-containing protein [Kordia sp. TARA_039_SRF]